MALRVGVIGSGGIGAAHIQAYQQTATTELVGVADIAVEFAQKAADKWNVGWAGTPEELLARDDVDAVSICTPPNVHASLGQAAIAAGKHVLVEKPVATNLAEADALIAAAKAADRVLMVAHSHRFWAANRKVKALLEEGAIGTLVSINDEIFSELRAGSGSLPWRLQREVAGGGVVMDNGVHGLDRLAYWAGAPAVRLYGRVHTIEDRVDVENNGEALIEFANGVVATLRVSTTAIPEAGRCRTEFLGTDGAITAETWGEVKIARRGKGWERVPVEGPGAFEAEAAEFAAAIAEKRQPLVTGEIGRAALAMVLALYESSETGRAVEL